MTDKRGESQLYSWLVIPWAKGELAPCLPEMAAFNQNRARVNQTCKNAVRCSGTTFSHSSVGSMYQRIGATSLETLRQYVGPYRSTQPICSGVPLKQKIPGSASKPVASNR